MKYVRDQALLDRLMGRPRPAPLPTNHPDHPFYRFAHGDHALPDESCSVSATPSPWGWNDGVPERYGFYVVRTSYGPRFSLWDKSNWSYFWSGVIPTGCTLSDYTKQKHVSRFPWRSMWGNPAHAVLPRSRRPAAGHTYATVDERGYWALRTWLGDEWSAPWAPFDNDARAVYSDGLRYMEWDPLSPSA